VSAEGQARLRSGSRLLGTAARRIETGDRSEDVEAKLREAMSVLRSAMNHLEDTPQFETAHRRIDQAGELARRHFRSGCALPFEDGSYHQRCPVALAHNRVGLSIEYILRASECSICGLDDDECSHITGRVYDGKSCVRVITDAKVTGVAVVGRPAFADARFGSVGVSTEALQRRLGKHFKAGVTSVYCDRCLSTCRGVSRPFESSGH
jgi:hypothetical protein